MVRNGRLSQGVILRTRNMSDLVITNFYSTFGFFSHIFFAYAGHGPTIMEVPGRLCYGRLVIVVLGISNR